MNEIRKEELVVVFPCKQSRKAENGDLSRNPLQDTESISVKSSSSKSLNSTGKTDQTENPFVKNTEIRD